MRKNPKDKINAGRDKAIRRKISLTNTKKGSTKTRSKIKV